jgi:hypothetical protein
MLGRSHRNDPNTKTAMILTPKNYNAATARSLKIRRTANCYWAIDPTDAFDGKYKLGNGERVGLMKKDIGQREAGRKGWDQENTNYGHSLSLKNAFINHPAFADVRDHFMTLQPEITDTTPCSGSNFYGTKHSFTILESIAFFLFHNFQLHLEGSFLRELPTGVRAIVSGVQSRLDRGLNGPVAVEALS